MVEAATIAGKEDPELVAGLRDAWPARGVTLLEGAEVTAVEPGPSARPGRRAADRAAATCWSRSAGGRTLQALDLAAGNVRAGPAGIATDRGLRSLTNRRVYAVGDIADPQGIGPRAFTHVGSYHAGIVIRRALFRLPARIDYAALPRVTYTQSGTGAGRHDRGRGARRRPPGCRFCAGRSPTTTARSPKRDTPGLVKLVVAGSRVIGAGILAPNAGEMIGLWTLAIAQRVKLAMLASLIVPYPTRSEAGKRAAANFFAPRLFAPRTKALVRLLARLP